MVSSSALSPAAIRLARLPVGLEHPRNILRCVSAELPRSLSSLDGADAAFEVALEVHGDGGIEHPIGVAERVRVSGLGEEVVIAALLHDVVECDGPPPGELAARFGDRVAELVAVLTEDGSIEDYEARKAEHRERIVAHSDDAASIYLADKIQRLSSFAEAGESPRPERLRHYRRAVELCSRHQAGDAGLMAGARDALGYFD